MKRWIIRIALLLAASIALATVTGSAYERIQRYQTKHDFPPLGTLVDIGGRRIQLDCRGTGSPTVVFESGLDINGSLSWSAVQGAVAKTTRACSYSRAGIMWSDPSRGVQNGKAVVDDLHKTLQAAGEHGPFVLVGHSLGGPYIMTYTKYYGQDVAGLVFVDASHPDQVERLKAVTPQQSAFFGKLLVSLAWTGALRQFVGGVVQQQPHQDMQDVAMIRAYAPTSLGPMLAENAALDQTLAEAGTFRQLGNRPLYVLTAMAPLSKAELQSMHMNAAQGVHMREVWKQMQDDEASWSSRSQHQLVGDSSHNIQFHRPDVVIHAVLSVVDLVRADEQH
ncbi:alpha/beta fold hydrolase [Paraburkholderia phenazinium]|uniref:Pimeloyl-ACP methyl ester carboxylesterase n=1 Tax=Paraburkholderia phenazinium TaxID=60549 RepID=A0A1G7X8A3_9BURK|nr:alpha/beta hydrolase [Paraburkholderia phenazinium]SDG80412.1 Pimeloyl-ACP methyl ester carboxylesterase [Paraburkholderia phenazinium]